MSHQLPHPTPYSDVNAMIHEVLSGARMVLGDDLLGMYLTGSLATGDFDPVNSDIDFIVVTAGELRPETIAALVAMHARIASGPSKWARELEGSYIPQRDLRRYDPAHAMHPHIFRGHGEGESRLFMMQHASDWIIQRHVLRERGVVVVGPPPHTFVDPIAPEDLRRAVRELTRVWPEPLLQDPEPLRQNGFHAYTVVTLCRMLYTLQHGTIVSKPVAAHWAQTAYGDRWAALIERALAWAMRWEDLHTTLDLMRYTFERIKQDESPANGAALSGGHEAGNEPATDRVKETEDVFDPDASDLRRP